MWPDGPNAVDTGLPDDPVFSEVYETHRPWAVGYFVRKGFLREQALEFTQDVFLCVYLNRKHLEPVERRVPWLVTVVRNKAISEHRRRAFQGRHLSLVEAPEAFRDDFTPDPEGRAASFEEISALHARIGQMPEMMRRCLLLRYVHDLGPQEAADLLGLSVNTVKTHLRRGLEFLREGLSPAGEARP
jgi:RNA polymerase sigma-70 factor (ECF subfamily)